MKPKVYITSTKKNSEKDLIDAESYFSIIVSFIIVPKCNPLGPI